MEEGWTFDWFCIMIENSRTMDEDSKIREKFMFKTAIITASDRGFQGLREDLSGKEIEQMLDADYEIVSKQILPDDRQMLSEAMKKLSNEGIDVIFTTGGTGFSKRDVTPEATLDVIDRQTPGITQAMMFHSLSITPKAMLSRAVSGICQNTLIINLPGSPKAVRENLEFIIEPLKHGIEILKGTSSECGEK